MVHGLGKVDALHLAFAHALEEVIQRHPIECDRVVAAQMMRDLVRELRRKVLGCAGIEPLRQGLQRGPDRSLGRTARTKPCARLYLSYELIVCHDANTS